MLLALAAALSHQPLPPRDESDRGRPLITAEADGSFIIHRDIHPNDPPVDFHTRGLLTERCGRARICSGRSEEAVDRRRDRVERAFEQAVDQARDARRD